jgi:hypothetical protein
MLVKLSLPPTPTITIVCSFCIALLVIAPGVPVGAITLRYNLVASHICGERASYFWAVFAPWLFAFVFCQGQSFAQLLTWSTLFLNAATNFLLPIMLYRTAVTRVLDAAHAVATEGSGTLQDIEESEQAASAVEEALVPAAVTLPVAAVELKTALVDEDGTDDADLTGEYHALTDEAAPEVERPSTKVGTKSVHFFLRADAAPRSVVQDTRRRSVRVKARSMCVEKWLLRACFIHL